MELIKLDANFNIMNFYVNYVIFWTKKTDISVRHKWSWGGDVAQLIEH